MARIERVTKQREEQAAPPLKLVESRPAFVPTKKSALGRLAGL